LKTVVAFIGLGANLGDAKATVHAAAQELREACGLSDFTLSPLYGSAPIDSSGPDYINAVARVRTTLSAQELLALLQAIEHSHGRLRPYRNAPRTLDLDLLLYGNETVNDTNLIVPHPRMHERAFVLRPLADLAPDLRLAQGTLDQLLEQCKDQALYVLPDS
jgi:2-amino-4-hydroxy-6-hydroxymethyldihydropteridine diphosphokinase